MLRKRNWLSCDLGVPMSPSTCYANIRKILCKEIYHILTLCATLWTLILSIDRLVDPFLSTRGGIVCPFTLPNFSKLIY